MTISLDKLCYTAGSFILWLFTMFFCLQVLDVNNENAELVVNICDKIAEMESAYALLIQVEIRVLWYEGKVRILSNFPTFAASFWKISRSN